MVRMSDMMSWWHYMVAVQCNFNRYACGLGTIQSNMPPGPLEIKEKSYLTDAPSSDTPTNTDKTLLAKTATLSIQHACCVESCYVTAAARWMLAGLWPLNQHACWPFVTQYCMSAGVVLLYLLYLLVWCLTISSVCWYCVSLSAVPADVVNHYRSCLLVWYITISHACWCGASI